tara:strand:+ start:2351 stop:2752 length:402 start_codon:yes stop_codon:yes gene_type:complete
MLAGVGLLLVCCSSSSLMVGMMGGEKTVEETASKPSKSDSDDTEAKAAPDSSTPPEPYADWRVEEGIDYPYNDIFHYHPNSTIKSSKEVCLDKCKEMSNCKLVTFNNDKTLCWGKSKAENKREHGDRNNYFKP